MIKRKQTKAAPGTLGGGDYFRIVVRPKEQFVTFRYHDVGREGHIQRLSGKRPSGSWDTQAWLISKEDAHIRGERLIADTDKAQEVIESLASKPRHIEGDIFEAEDQSSKAQRLHWETVAHRIRLKLGKNKQSEQV